MILNSNLRKATGVGALGGLLFGFDTAVIAGTTHSLSALYELSPKALGLTVSMALIGTVVGAISAGVPGQRWGGRETLRILAVFYLVSALGCAFAWNWYVLLLARFIGGLAIGGSSVLGPVYIAELAPAKWRGRLVGLFQVNIRHRHFAGLLFQLCDCAVRFGRSRVALEIRRCRCSRSRLSILAVFYPAQPAMAGRTRASAGSSRSPADDGFR
jgi:hypothetical protein